MDILNPDEYTEIEGRAYLSPQVALNESNEFIENLRSTQAQQNQQIVQDTYNLGTEVSSNLGGLGAPTDTGLSYFTSRYQTPQTNATVANLRATAQAAALNQALENEQAKWKKRYQDAYRKYQKRAYDKANTPSTSPTNPSVDTITGQVDETTSDRTAQGRLILDENDLAEGGVFLVEPGSGNIIGEGFSGDNPRYVRQEDGSYRRYSPSSSGNGSYIDLTGLITNFKQPVRVKTGNTGRNQLTTGGASGR